jgi:ankyrin repeat protein
MFNELHRCAKFGDLEGVTELVEGGANMEEFDGTGGITALMRTCPKCRHDIVVYLVEHGANAAHPDDHGVTAIHLACAHGNLPTAKYLLEHGARITDRDSEGKTALLHAAECESYVDQHLCLELIQYLLSSEGGVSITETDNDGNTALLLAAGIDCYPVMVQWLLEYGGAQITETNKYGCTVWTVEPYAGLPDFLRCAYVKKKGEYVSIDDEYVPKKDIVALTAMLRVMVLHGGPPESLVAELAPPLQQIVQEGARLRARLPAYLAQRRALLDAHCPLLPPLRDLVHGYEEPTTTDELWATGLGAPLLRAKRSRPEGGQSPERRSARLCQKRQ